MTVKRTVVRWLGFVLAAALLAFVLKVVLQVDPQVLAGFNCCPRRDLGLPLGQRS